MPHAPRPAFRFAPSPNGRLHLGHALSAITGFEAARAVGGRFLVRIEDIDVARTREAFVQGILEDLAWLGLSWEQPVLRQSERFPVYQTAARRLEADRLLYPCFCTRSGIEARAHPGLCDPDGAPLYPGTCRTLSPEKVLARRADGEPHALRLDMERAMAAAHRALDGRPLSFADSGGGDGRAGDVRGGLGAAFPAAEVVLARPRRWGDAVIVRKDVPASYHLAVVVDDAAQGITHVTRGADLLAATDLHRLLQVLLDLPEPAYHHHRLLADAGGRKLAKSAGDTTLASLRDAGVTPIDIRRMVGLAD